MLSPHLPSSQHLASPCDNSRSSTGGVRQNMKYFQNSITSGSPRSVLCFTRRTRWGHNLSDQPNWFHPILLTIFQVTPFVHHHNLKSHNHHNLHSFNLNLRYGWRKPRLTVAIICVNMWHERKAISNICSIRFVPRRKGCFSRKLISCENSWKVNFWLSSSVMVGQWRFFFTWWCIFKFITVHCPLKMGKSFAKLSFPKQILSDWLLATFKEDQKCWTWRSGPWLMTKDCLWPG